MEQDVDDDKIGKTQYDKTDDMMAVTELDKDDEKRLKG